MARVLPLSSPSRAAVIETARATVAGDGVLAIPTESFYALAASAWQPAALHRVNAIKGRPAGKPLLLLIADPAQLRELVTDIPPAARLLTERFWPGPLTLVFPASPRLPADLTAGTGTIGIRLPRVPALIPLLQAAGPLTGTSANRSGEAPVTTGEEVARTLGDAVDLILDGGPTPGGALSTLLDARGPVRLLRDGALPRGRIEAALEEAGLALSR